MSEQTTDLTLLTAEIIGAYVENNEVRVEALPDLIKAVYGALIGLGGDSEEPAAEEPKPSAYQVRKSISEGGLVSFIDGRAYKTLKRHLGTHGMTPDEYRSRFGLPASYPMVAPAYAAKRSELAKAAGLGRKPQPKPGRRKA